MNRGKPQRPLDRPKGCRSALDPPVGGTKPWRLARGYAPSVQQALSARSGGEDWQQHGREVFKRVRRESPAAYLKVCAMLVPKEVKLEHSTSAIKAMTDEQIEQAIEAIQIMLAARADETAKVIEGEAEVVPSLPPPKAPKTAS
jgi:hypothetical protein